MFVLALSAAEGFDNPYRGKRPFLHGFARNNQVDDSVYDSAEYRAEQRNVITRDDKLDYVNNDCSNDKACQTPAERGSIHSEYPLCKIIQKSYYSGSNKQGPYAGYGKTGC